MLAHLLELDRAIFMALFGGSAPGSILYLMLGLTIVGRGYVIIVVAALALMPHAAARHLPRRVFSLERQRLARELLAVLVVTALLVVGGKLLIARPRPYLALDLMPIGSAPTDFSCPSGHAAGAFAFAMYFVARLHPSRRTSTLLLVIAAGIALSRIYLGAHYPSDVVLGGLLGTACGGLAGRVFRVRAMTRARHSAEVAPTAPASP